MVQKQILPRHSACSRRLHRTGLIIAAALLWNIPANGLRGDDSLGRGDIVVSDSSDRFSDPHERIDELRLRLARIVERPAHEQHYEQIAMEASRMLQTSRSVTERELVRDLLETINHHRARVQQSRVEDAPALRSRASSYVEDAYVMPAQFQPSSTTRQMMTGGQTPSFQNQSNQRTPQSFNVRLARAPNMMGDFFGQASAQQTLESFIGRGVHHVSSVNDIHLIDESGPQVLYVGGPGGITPGSYFVEPPFIDLVGPPPPLPDRVEGLVSDVDGDFVAVRTTDITSVFDDPGDLVADLENVEVFNVYQVLAISLPGSPGDIIGRIRLSENNSAMPQDRIYFDYSFFHNVPLSSGGVEVHRFAPGAEKTFFNGMASVELRVPTGISISSDVVADAPADVTQGEFGNIVVSSKVLLAEMENVAFAAGCGIALPTADDLIVTDADGSLLLLVDNEAVHLLPYLAFLYAPNNSPFFGHAFLTLDLDMGGNPAFADPDGNGFRQAGILNDQNLISTHLALGSWIYQNSSQASRLQGIALSGEIHTTNALNDADSIPLGSGTLGDPNANLSLVNATFGAHAQVCQTTFTAGYCTPLSSDRVFDGELRIFVNRAF
jgi:hypothetical protein